MLDFNILNCNHINIKKKKIKQNKYLYYCPDCNLFYIKKVILNNNKLIFNNKIISKGKIKKFESISTEEKIKIINEELIYLIIGNTPTYKLKIDYLTHNEVELHKKSGTINYEIMHYLNKVILLLEYRNNLLKNNTNIVKIKK